MKKVLIIFTIVVLFANHAFANGNDDDNADDVDVRVDVELAHGWRPPRGGK